MDNISKNTVKLPVWDLETDKIIEIEVNQKQLRTLKQTTREQRECFEELLANYTF